MNLERVKYKNGRAYIEYVRKTGKQKGQIVRDYGQIIICQVCNKECFAKDSHIKYNRGKFCSHKCQNKLENHPRWKNGRKKERGYRMILQHSHPSADSNGYIYEHRLIVEKQIGRYLYHWETVHHVNEIRDDNRPQKLMAFISKSAHKRFEGKGNVLQKEIIFDGRKLCKIKGVKNGK